MKPLRKLLTPVTAAIFSLVFSLAASGQTYNAAADFFAPYPQRYQQWSPGWDVFEEQLDYNTSKVIWCRLDRSLFVNYILRGATPHRQYQVGVHIFDRCDDDQFGHFSLLGCDEATRDGITRYIHSIELGVVTTDSRGNGSFSTLVEDIRAGVYEIEFHVRTGVGCLFVDESCIETCTGSGICGVIFQSPGPYGVGTTKIRFPRYYEQDWD